MPVPSFGQSCLRLPDDGTAWIAPSASVIGDVCLGSSASIWFGAVVRGDNTPIRIGDRSNIQDLAMLHSDPGDPLVIGHMVTVGHGAILHGCTVGDRVLIGMGAIVLNGATIEADTIVAAGSVVPGGRTYPAGSLIIGSPAVVRRNLTEEEIASIKANAELYVTKARQMMHS